VCTEQVSGRTCVMHLLCAFRSGSSPDLVHTKLEQETASLIA
jgi:hypothetical protein